jgi:hypothetical protein
VNEPRDLRDLLGDEVGPEELAELGRVDELLRSVPPPPATVPGSLTQSVARIPEARGSASTPRRLLLAAALALALAALAFGVGRWSGDGQESYRTAVQMVAAESNPQASAVIRLGERDPASGNWKLIVEVDGLPTLGRGDYYVLWLAKDGEYAATCGTFNVRGRTTVEMTASYRLSEYDSWVISRAQDDAPWLLSAKI